MEQSAENGSDPTPLAPLMCDPEAPTAPPQIRIVHVVPQVELNLIPNNVDSKEQLKLLPPEFLSGNEARPLQHIDDKEERLEYALKPMAYSVIFILLVELLERFSFYGINYTQTSFLTGAYDEDWNADMSAVAASSYVSVCIAIAYTSPFLGAFLADSFLGEYWTIIFGAVCFYIPGLVIIAMATVPGLLGDTFNKTALSIGLLGLWPLGTGMVKSVVNVFGAKQFHPLIQSALIESYYVNFYMCINIGALAGGIIVPIVAQHDITVAYFIPVVMLTLGVLCFLAGTKRYVISKPRGDLMASSNDGTGLSVNAVARVCLLIVPFNIAYSQMATTFIVQGTVMQKALGFIDAASMNNADAVAVLFFGYIIGNYLYPWQAKEGKKFPTTYKFALGSFLGVLAIAWALFVDYLIRSTYEATGEKISVLWQAPSYVLIGIGEIFAVSSAYEVAFTAAPPQKKALASAFNLFNVGGLPNLVCIFLYHACSQWFENASGVSSIHTLPHYAEAHIYKYFLVLLVIAISGVAVNLHPSIKNWVQSIEDNAAEAIKTPCATPILARRKQERGENGPLLSKIKENQQFLKYGTGPILHKTGSMRAAPFLRQTDPKALKRQQKYTQYQQLKKHPIRHEHPDDDSKPAVDSRSKEAPY
jgi:POT family proton-dependent oligopeptide transporter